MRVFQFSHLLRVELVRRHLQGEKICALAKDYDKDPRSLYAAKKSVWWRRIKEFLLEHGINTEVPVDIGTRGDIK